MGFLAGLFAAPKALDVADKIVDGAVRGIDALFFTDEEKSRASLEAIQLWIKTQEVIRDESTARSITRRILAVIILGGTFLMGLAACALYKLDPLWSLFIIDVLKEFGFMTGAVTVFYFGYYGFKQIVGEKK